jgi:predicted nucleic acid-binding protein
VNADDPGDRTQQFLSSVHRDNATAPIVASDAMGAFFGSSLDVLLGEALPLVVDANVLRNDIGYVCRTGRRTTLLTATNARIFRLYCAQHVYDEVEEHAAEWAADMELDPDAYLSAWRKNYVPLARRVDTDGMESLLSPAERQRVDRLRLLLDVDDVPSAVLALATGAFFLSEDGAPHETVYGRTLSAAERSAWLPILQAGGDSAELTRLVAFTGAVPAFAVMGGAYVARRLWALSPLLLLSVLAFAAVLATRVPRDRYRAGGQAILTTLSVLSTHVYQPQYEALERFRSALPPFPSWDDLVAALPRDAALARACLYRLARSRRSPIHARDLADELPTLGIGQAPQRVGKVLHRYECFDEPYRGIWQLGSPVGPV